MLRIENVVTDRGSRYAVCGGSVDGRDGAQAFLRALLREKRYAKATHNSWGLLIGGAEGGGAAGAEPVKSDDGEVGAGATILRMLERANMVDHIVVVTRWYGGVKLGGDRFRHVQQAVRAYLDALAEAGAGR